MLSEATWLTPDQHVRLLAVASAVTGTVRLLADDPGTAITHGVARMCAILVLCHRSLSTCHRILSGLDH
ncbi:hypothetical protein G3I37_38480 [Streptomyces anulatus]|uniref:Uncharacterized protein n=2 Tax=Streptomyces anulatus TaxID=1892 RepID=A0A7K3RMK3_STRAQ|nr:hypothetical protein [Streptomyces anulatus]NED30720.1 hypothetical protein [Streptomyces anulatus]